MSMMHWILLPILGIARAHPALHHVYLQRHERPSKVKVVTLPFQSPCEVMETLSVVGSTTCATREDSALILSAWKLRASQNSTLTLPAKRINSVNVQDLFESTQKLGNHQDLLYTVNASIGANNAPVRLIVDTGSSDIWVKPDAYQWKESSTASASHHSINLTYGIGYVVGEVVRDKFCVDSICAKSQTLLSATRVQGINDDSFYDGLLGLAYPALSLTRGSFMQTLLNSSRFTSPGFALSLAEEDDRSFIVFGDVSDLVESAKSKGFGMGHTVTLASPTYWMVEAAISSPRNADGTVIAPTQIYCALDSGTSLLTVPQQSLHPLLIQVLGVSNFLNGSCNSNFCLCAVDTNPFFLDFTSLEGTLRIELTKADLLRPLGYNSAGQPVCMVNIAALPDLPLWILGDVFMRKAYVVHDVRSFQLIFFTHQPKASTPKQDMAFLYQLLALVFFAIICVAPYRLVYLCGRRAGRISQQDTQYVHLAA